VLCIHIRPRSDGAHLQRETRRSSVP
jgi:hypothetical protein